MTVGEARRARAERCGVWRCAWCHAGFEEGAEPRAVCRECLALHHAACWDEAGACATCREPLALRERGEPGPTTRKAAEEAAAEALAAKDGVVAGRVVRWAAGALAVARRALARALTWGRGHARGLLAGGVWSSLAGAVWALAEPRGQERLVVSLAWLLTSWLCLLGWCLADRRAGRRYGAGAGAPRRTTIAYHTPAEPRRPA